MQIWEQLNTEEGAKALACDERRLQREISGALARPQVGEKGVGRATAPRPDFDAISRDLMALSDELAN